jgi:phenylalanyl-tRNA synthetase beta chain
MKFTLSWLKEHLETQATLDEIVAAMVEVGLEVEHVDDPKKRLAAFSIGEVVSAEKHPDADKLRVCKVATKDGVLQIVCGAPNARAGIKVAYAPVGAYVPGIDVTLTKAKIRGVESMGMMCSSRELLLGEDHDGIIEAPLNAAVGAPLADIMGGDAVIEFEVTPNRPDTNGVAGVARDLAAKGLGRLVTPAPQKIVGAFANPQKIALEFPQGAESACSAFAGRLIRGVKNGPSPQWLQDRLRAIGLRPINALVDVTNYITYDRARPLHVYDADKLKGVIRARLGRAGEEFKALDGKTYAVDETMCVIADDRAVLGLGGIIGGEETGSSEATVNVFIECAFFDPLRTAKTGRKTGIVSDARYRFERGVDPAFVLPGLELATRMILDLCGGEPGEIALAGAPPARNITVAYPVTETKRLTGVDVSPERQVEILSALGFSVQRSEPWLVDAPTWRPDIEGKADIVEEIIRIEGFARLPAQPLPALKAVEGPKLTPAQQRRRFARRALAGRGMMEAVTWSFCDEKNAALFMSANELKAKGLILANPIASDLGVMRPSILPNLIAALQRNADRGRDDLALFEAGPDYQGDRPEDQRDIVAGARRIAPPRHWEKQGEADGVFIVKADAIAALEAAGAPAASLQATADAPSYFHPGRSGALRLGAKALAFFGEAHPRMLKAMDIDGRVYAFEVMLGAIPPAKPRAAKTKPALAASGLLPVTRDFAFLVDEAVAAEALVKAVKGADKALIANARLFDVYAGQGVPAGKKSLAVEVTLQPKDKTLTDAEIEAVGAMIVAAVAKATGGALRG